jgi:hypothetical protein
MKLNKKYVIGTHVMFYEIDMVGEFIESCINALEVIDNKENVKFHFCLNLSEYFEKFDTDTRRVEIISKWHEIIKVLDEMGVEADTDYYENNDKPYFIGDYRRDLNYNHCMDYDFVIWGESDCLMNMLNHKA